MDNSQLSTFVVEAVLVVCFLLTNKTQDLVASSSSYFTHVVWHGSAGTARLCSMQRQLEQLELGLEDPLVYCRGWVAH